MRLAPVLAALSAIAILLACDVKPPPVAQKKLSATASPAAVPEKGPAIDADRLTVKTDPPDCLILLDDRVVGMSPLAILSLPSRTMRLRAEKAGYLPAVKDIRTGDGQHLIVDLALAPDSGSGGVEAAGPRYMVSGVRPDDTLNLRAGPGAAQRILAKIGPAEGGLVARGPEERSEGQLWIEVSWRGQAGWVNSAYLKPESDGDGEGDGRAGPVGRAVPGHADFDAWLDRPLSFSDVTTRSSEELRLWVNYYYAVDGCPFKSEDLKSFYSALPWYDPAPGFSESAMPKVHRANVRLLTKVAEQVPYLGSGGGQGAARTINDNLVNMRAGPSLQASILFTLDRGDTVIVFGRTEAEDRVTTSTLKGVPDYWFHVETELGARAWVFGYFVDFRDEAAKEAIPVGM
jgi:uncharacterized protein YraI